MTNHELITSEIGLLADALVNQEYCEKCPYNKKGLCAFDQDKEEVAMHMACYNAALEWLMGDAW